MQVIVLFFGFDPDFTLTLWINQQRKTLSFSDNCSILKGQLIIGETLQSPLRRLDGVHQHVDHVEGVGVRDVPIFEQALPVLEKSCSEFLIEGSGV